jgi:hypothetical protein
MDFMRKREPFMPERELEGVAKEALEDIEKEGPRS